MILKLIQKMARSLSNPVTMQNSDQTNQKCLDVYTGNKRQEISKNENDHELYIYFINYIFKIGGYNIIKIKFIFQI